MKSLSFFISLCFSLLLLNPFSTASTTTNSASYIPADNILLNCGASSDASDLDDRKWTGDVNSQFALSSQNSQTAQASSQDPSLPSSVPYMTARISHKQFTYAFPVGSPRLWVRLYFYPSSYNNLSASDSFFSVTSGPYTLLHNFSASLTTQAMNYAYLMHEFSVNSTAGFLNLTFTPSANAYAFVNGIEIVSMPDLLFDSARFVGTTQIYPVQSNIAFQNVFRLNVGGAAISPVKDSGLYRTWVDDSPYIYGAAFGVSYSADPNITMKYPGNQPAYIAPKDVYGTARSMGPEFNLNMKYNLTWIMPVDPGFFYLVRFHFCEIQVAFIRLLNQRVFTIFINNQTAEVEADVIAWAGSNGEPVYKDYVVFVNNQTSSPNLWVALHPNPESGSQWYDAILNGLEVFKLNDSLGNLAGPNPIPLNPPDSSQNQADVSSSKDSSSRIPIIAGTVGGVVVISLIALVIFSLVRRRKGKDSSSSDGPSGWLPLSLYGNSHTANSKSSANSGKTGTTGSYASSLPSNLCRHFSFADIKAATNNFDDSLLLGVGGFGKVHKGIIDGGTKVAIKRGNPLSEQGVHEFQTEIEMLSKLRHRHLVSLIGYCEENCEMILVYDYMAHGTLREHLYKTNKPPLSWKQRLEICIGAARGLHYLHTGAKYTIIHRDVKTTNILLDDKWVAKVSDFGLSKTGPTLDNTHVSTVVKGSFGYLDPEYFRRQQLTDKSDVYSFGVVLFEVLCARPALNSTLPKEQVSLAEWALRCQKKGMLDQIIDPLLKGKIAPECFRKFAETAEKCVSDQGTDRPSMGDVLWNLEFALQLQESADETAGDVITSGVGVDMDIEEALMPGKKDSEGLGIDNSRSVGMMSTGGRSLASDDSDGLTPSAVFSQLVNPKGR